MNNKRLNNLFKLSVRVSVYVPSTDSNNSTIDNSIEVENCAKFLTEKFGGASANPITGYWNSDTNGLVKENTVIVFAYTTQVILESAIDSILDYCESIKTRLGQDSVALELGNNFYLV